MDKVYNYSEEQIKKTKKMQLLNVILISLMVTFVYIFICGLETMGYCFLIIILTVIIITSIFMGVIFHLVINEKLRETKIILSEEDIVRRAGKSLELIRYEDLKKIKVKKTPSGKVKDIKLVSSVSSIIIVGFENMDELVEEIKERIYDSSILYQKKEKLDFNNPIVFIVFYVLMVVVFLIIARISSDFVVVLSYGIYIALGIFYIFLRPFSKRNGKKFIILDLIIAILVLYFGVDGLIYIF